MGFTFVDDVTRAFIGSAPSGATLAGYTTGSNGIAWGMADWAAHPTAIRIDQDAGASDYTADILDVEFGAATLNEIVRWVTNARIKRAAGARPGQRDPGLYFSLSNLSGIVNTLNSAGLTKVPLWIADWMNSQSVAESMIGVMHSGHPCVGVQYRNAGTFDMDVFDSGWFASSAVVTMPSFPLSQGMNDHGPTGLIHTLQANLNRWHGVLAFGALLTVDGVFGPLTKTAVTAAQTTFGERGMPAGTCDQAIFSHLSAAIPVPGGLVFPAPGNLRTSKVDKGWTVTASWQDVKGAVSYHFQLEWWKGSFGWVLSVDETVKALSYTTDLAGMTRFRWRVAVPGGGGTWSAWVEGVTS